MSSPIADIARILWTGSFFSKRVYPAFLLLRSEARFLLHCNAQLRDRPSVRSGLAEYRRALFQKGAIAFLEIRAGKGFEKQGSRHLIIFGLAGLDERGLKDVALSRADIAPEVAKPFWRA